MRDVCPQCGGPRKDEAIVWSGATVWFRCSLCEWVWRSSLQLIVGNLLSSAHLPVQPPVEQVQTQPEAVPQPEVAPDETVWLSNWFRCSRSEWVWPGALSPVAVRSLVRDAHPPVQPPVEPVETLLEVMPQPEAKVETQPVALPQPEARVEPEALPQSETKIETQPEALPQPEARHDDAPSGPEKVQLPGELQPLLAPQETAKDAEPPFWTAWLSERDPASSQQPRRRAVADLSEWTDVDAPVAVITGRQDAPPAAMLDLVPPTTEELPPTLVAEQPTMTAGRSTIDDQDAVSSHQVRTGTVDKLSEWTDIDGPVAVIGAQFGDVPPTMDELNSTLAAEEPAPKSGPWTMEDRRAPVDNGQWTGVDRRKPPHDDLSEWTDADGPVVEIVGPAAGSEEISREGKTVWQRIKSAKLLRTAKRPDPVNPPVADPTNHLIADPVTQPTAAPVTQPIAASVDPPKQEAVSSKTALTAALDRIISNVEGTAKAFARLQQQLAGIEDVCDQLIQEPDDPQSPADHRPSTADHRPPTIH